MPGGSAFKAKFEAKYGKIQNYSPYAYDAMHVLIDAMKRADSSDLQVSGRTAEDGLPGVTGRIRFDAKGTSPAARHPVSGERRQMADARNRAQRQLS